MQDARTGWIVGLPVMSRVGRRLGDHADMWCRFFAHRVCSYERRGARGATSQCMYVVWCSRRMEFLTEARERKNAGILRLTRTKLSPVSLPPSILRTSPSAMGTSRVSLPTSSTTLDVVPPSPRCVSRQHTTSRDFFFLLRVFLLFASCLPFREP